MSSLLDVGLERLAAAERGLQPIARVCLVGSLSPGASADAFGAWCADFCKPPAAVTGLLLLFPTGWLQTMEGPTADLLPLLHAMAAQLDPGAMLRTVSVISAQEDVRGRYFSTYVHRQVSAVRNNYCEIEEGNDSAVPAFLSELAIGMLKIGKKLKDGTPPSALDSWEGHFADCMPSNERVTQVLDLHEVPTLADFLAIYDTPVNVVLQVRPPNRPSPTAQPAPPPHVTAPTSAHPPPAAAPHRRPRAPARPPARPRDSACAQRAAASTSARLPWLACPADSSPSCLHSCARSRIASGRRSARSRTEGARGAPAATRPRAVRKACDGARVS